jgi:endoglucanase
VRHALGFLLVIALSLGIATIDSPTAPSTSADTQATAEPNASPPARPIPALPPAPDPGAASPIRVRGNRLVNAAGVPLLLRGVNRSGLEYACVQNFGIFGSPVDQASIDAMKRWNINAVRIGLNSNCWLGIGTPAAYSGPAYQQAVADYVTLLSRNGLYAIITGQWQSTAPSMAAHQAMPDANAPALWTQVASAFKGNDAVLFEPWGEPFPDNNRDTTAAWICWRDGGTCPGVPFPTTGMQSIVNAIRATGATNVIALSGVMYSSRLTQWLSYKPNDPLDNLAASWHVYNNHTCSAAACYDQTVGKVGSQVPVTATEFGDASCDVTWLNTLMSWLDTKRIGYVAWVWETWGPYCQSLALITDYSGAPTTWGQIYKAYLAGQP